MSTVFAKVGRIDPELARKLESIHQALIRAGANSAGQRLSMVAEHKVVASGPCSLVLDFYRERHLLQTIQLQFDSVEAKPLLPTAAAEE